MPFGGGGALHVGALIRQIGLKCALVPRFPGITSALGCVLADLPADPASDAPLPATVRRALGVRDGDAVRCVLLHRQDQNESSGEAQ